jgi:hypothetical protein
MRLNAHAFFDGGRANAINFGCSSFSDAVRVAQRQRNQFRNGIMLWLAAASLV